MNAEALDQGKKAEKAAANALSNAISAMNSSGIPPGELSTHWKIRLMYTDFIASDDAIQQVNDHIKTIPEALQQAEAAQVPGYVARIKTILATANVVQAAAKSMGARLKAEFAVSARNTRSAKAIAAQTPGIQQALQTAQAAAKEAIAAAKPVIQQALQDAQAAAKAEKEVEFPTGGTLKSIFLSLGSEQREQTTNIAQEYLAKIKADAQAVEALSQSKNLHCIIGEVARQARLLKAGSTQK